MQQPEKPCRSSQCWFFGDWVDLRIELFSVFGRWHRGEDIMCVQMSFRASICPSSHGSNLENINKNQSTHAYIISRQWLSVKQRMKRERENDSRGWTKSGYIELFYRFNLTKSTAVHLLFLFGIAASFVVLFLLLLFSSNRLRHHQCSIRFIWICAQCTHLYPTCVCVWICIYMYPSIWSRM